VFISYSDNITQILASTREEQIHSRSSQRKRQSLRSRSRTGRSKEKRKAYMKSLAEATRPLQHLNIVRHTLSDDGTFPNNGRLPLLLYQKAFQLTDEESGNTIKEVLETNSWTDSWEDGVYDYHHYHSTAHEVLVIHRGAARIQFGGPGGIALTVEPGDVVIIPAGVAHKKIEGDRNFSCIGAYPAGQKYDMNYGKKGERPKADENIKQLPLPEADPLYGRDGPLIKNWVSEQRQDRSVF
jgi:uncharacterized protein YjlB